MANRIGVIGAGVMGEALIAALIRSGTNPNQILFAEKRDERAQELTDKYLVSRGNVSELAQNSSIILLVVKPQDMQSTLTELAPDLNEEALLISFAAGKTIETISSGIGKANPIVRVMPNTPALIGEGASGYSIAPGVNQEQRDFVTSFLSALGKAIEVPESLQDSVTATSGSGPAYFFAFVEAMIEGAIALGLSREAASELTIQTFIGAAELLKQSGETPRALREKVTSPKGTTAAALASFEDSNLNSVVARAMKAAADRSEELK